ncbi:MAG: hypothetical protein ACOYK5_10285 [Bacteroidia bacterium]
MWGKIITATDLVWFVFLFLVFYWYANKVVNLNIKEKPHYRYFTRALVFRMLMSLVFLGIYIFYYGGGDTINYWEAANAYNNLFTANFDQFWELMTMRVNETNNYKFWEYLHGEGVVHGDIHPSIWKRSENLFIVRAATFPMILTRGSIAGTTAIFAFFSFLSIWKIYQIFLHYFPERHKELNISILLMPSVAFWGSGIMKDTLTMIGMGFFLDALFRRFVTHKIDPITFFIQAFISGWLIFNAKPYILIAMTPGLLVWLNFDSIKQIKSVLIRVVVLPTVVFGSLLGATAFYLKGGERFGEYSADTVLEKASLTQQDLVRDQYGDNKFDIGSFDPTIQGILPKIPIAINAGLYRPYLWESGSPTMFFSGLENTYLLFWSLVLLYRNKVLGIFTRIFSYPLFVFCLSFSLFLAFSIGLTAGNFGAMVRYKIPMLPFFTSMIVVLSFMKLAPKKNKSGPIVEGGKTKR